jgi:hypothetical protein
MKYNRKKDMNNLQKTNHFYAFEIHHYLSIFNKQKKDKKDILFNITEQII